MVIWLSSSTIARLRDQLRTRGARPSVALDPSITLDRAAAETLIAEYSPLCEAMFLMMSADGDVSAAERDVLKGALRNLSDDTLRSVHIDEMLDRAAKAIAADGREKRMNEVVQALDGDAARAEVAFVLAAAIAFADNAVADEENETLNAFAEGLGIDEERANALLDQVEQDLAAAPS